MFDSCIYVIAILIAVLPRSSTRRDDDSCSWNVGDGSEEAMQKSQDTLPVRMFALCINHLLELIFCWSQNVSALSKLSLALAPGGQTSPATNDSGVACKLVTLETTTNTQHPMSSYSAALLKLIDNNNQVPKVGFC